ncbi:hypothetical protein EN828_05510 [Mesorhizobium sp. M2D.F.Ca.ET.185.01.1.1]|uniref:hypothetical protein n=1 Tax=unclassified Mesorhizobium TaxID=325217 RepID=UPI000FCB6848|nr:MULTISPECIES: hypothetical protein [unclassified Mesorhizobium]TGP77430.1 hypothetical protein EN870_19545 [bacterium M00.F.Ca.ET.227.01.1.1]TGP93225.1 hypothetical protein EN865_19740 [bacterium M00.F.Ca.ET.222.01.1.1]TGP96771.1 hypothetical protein EN864_10025 [bacterium M00.F.Ca.ET.221.01.1.1]TGT95947.1 hypothetical protein EN806_53510 [bacterium M00.F.Ca.ET.163.01.1.1]TGU21188.1 hypothetical protein EN799_54700 [bacterium M00.F.Ca.ET.156.01.1.1]TGU49983.1 hypothetical protein EN789_054
MAKGSFNIGDEAAITATVRGRVTEDRVSVSRPSYGHPHSIVETATVAKGQPIELVGDVTFVDAEAGKLTGNLGVPVTLNADTLRLVMRYAPPKRKAPLVDKAT